MNAKLKPLERSQYENWTQDTVANPPQEAPPISVEPVPEEPMVAELVPEESTPEAVTGFEMVEPRLERAADFADHEVRALVVSATNSVRRHEQSPEAWAKAKAMVRRKVLATSLALAGLAVMGGLAPKPAEAGEKMRKGAEIGAVLLGEADMMLEEAYYRDVSKIQELESVWQQKEGEKEGLTQHYEQVSRRIARAEKNADFAQKQGDASGVREAMQYRDELKDEQMEIRERVRHIAAVQDVIERRMEEVGKGLKKKRIGGAIAGAGARVLDILSRGY